ncbi:hypothetical protein MIND_00933800 [Mycena indigotica]|uniref:Uncharacterized protein n=1 Tax=Mycena indigotica TaxID=2126181 RepID=A0A8H6SDZ8_9AGAR|nr:uncharacterized protein MIND_00933800 [Mycena indigotica]KAF7297015.1 hypothetical protein MIND_00933800 [Mycena indigotica]
MSTLNDTTTTPTPGGTMTTPTGGTMGLPTITQANCNSFDCAMTSMRIVYILVFVGVIVILVVLLALCFARRAYLIRRGRLTEFVPARRAEPAVLQRPPRMYELSMALEEKKAAEAFVWSNDGRWEGILPLSATSLPPPPTNTTPEKADPDAIPAPANDPRGPRWLPRRMRRSRESDPAGSVELATKNISEAQPEPAAMRVACLIAMPTPPAAAAVAVRDDDDGPSLPYFELAMVNVAVHDPVPSAENVGES